MSGVLIDNLVNFVLFSVNQPAFQNWCIQLSFHDFENDFRQSNHSSTSVNPNIDYYNCDRLFQDEVKWSLVCVAVMFLVYIHWTLVITSFVGGAFYRVPPPMIASAPQPAAVPPPPPPVEAAENATPAPVETNANIKPSSNNIQTYSNINPPKKAHTSVRFQDSPLRLASDDTMVAVDLGNHGQAYRANSLPISDVELGHSSTNYEL
ncbi:hypothetical protein EC973_005890 [Apophysomyces ossiformis]|uniref:Uncharacterized protein n=1 Tax=Apophysomyces ossiformis TaxID=679940 RepID=A0A8H7BK16_9FUNG|nr:hypothetical protein EC973_005890 [Apophysomyces ossiformis]